MGNRIRNYILFDECCYHKCNLFVFINANPRKTSPEDRLYPSSKTIE